MKTFYKYRGKLVDVEEHFRGVCEIVTDKSLVLLLDNYYDKMYDTAYENRDSKKKKIPILEETNQQIIKTILNEV